MSIKMKRFLGILLSLALVLGLMPGMSMTAYAAPTETLLTTITATGKEQASYSVANVATVSFSYTAGGSSAYLANWGWWGYGWTATVNAAEGYTITKCVFYDDANRTATDSSSPFVVETTEQDKTPRINGSPIDGGNNQSKGLKKIEVYGYAAPETPSGYTLTIPSTLSVANSGWNATSGISATGSLASGKKLTVTASSANSWALKSGDNSVGYKLATASADTEATTSWTFDSLSSTATKKDMGIIVEDYSTKPAGTYQDIVTFTAKVAATFGFSKQSWWGNPVTGEIDVPANFVSVSQTDAKAAADAEKTRANAPGYVCIYALEGGQYKWIDSHGRTGQHSDLLDIANADAWEEVYECYNAGDNNSIWFTVNK